MRTRAQLQSNPARERTLPVEQETEEPETAGAAADFAAHRPATPLERDDEELEQLVGGCASGPHAPTGIGGLPVSIGNEAGRSTTPAPDQAEPRLAWSFCIVLLLCSMKSPS